MAQKVNTIKGVKHNSKSLSRKKIHATNDEGNEQPHLPKMTKGVFQDQISFKHKFFRLDHFNFIFDDSGHV
jgi:hypothetical protein